MMYDVRLTESEIVYIKSNWKYCETIRDFILKTLSRKNVYANVGFSDRKDNLKDLVKLLRNVNK